MSSTPALHWHLGFYSCHPCKWLFSISHPKLNLNLFLTARFHTVILTYLHFSSSDLLHSSCCPCISEKLLSEQKRCSFSWSFIASSMVEVYIFLYRPSRKSPLQSCAVYSYVSRCNCSTAELFFIVTPFAVVCNCPLRALAKSIQQKWLGYQPCAWYCASGWRFIRHVISLLKTRGE